MTLAELGGMTLADRKAMARDPDLDIAVLARLAQDESWRVRVGVASNVAVPEALVYILAHDPHPYVGVRAARHPALTTATVETLAALDSDAVRAEAETRLLIARDPDAARRAVDEGRDRDRLLAAESPVLAPDLLPQLASDKGDLVRLAVAFNPTTPRAVLGALAHDIGAIRRALTTRADVPETVWVALAKDADASVRVSVASSPNAAPTALAIVARRGEDLDGLRAVAANPAAPSALLKRLGGHKRWDIRAAVVSNPSCPASVIKQLATKSPLVVRAAIAAAPHVAPDQLTRYVKDDFAVAFALAGNPALTPELATALLHHPNQYVAGRAASHPAVPPDSLAAFVRGLDRPAWMLRAAASNPSCPDEVATEVLTWIALGGTGPDNPVFDPVTCVGHPGDPKINEFTWYRSAAADAKNPDTHPLWRVRASTVSSRGRIPYYLIELLARDPRVEVRRTVARFDGMAMLSLEELCGDADSMVATQARAALVRARERPRGKRKRKLNLGVVAAIAAVSVMVILLGSGNDPSSSGTLTRLTLPEDLPFAVPIYAQLSTGASVEIVEASGTYRVDVRATIDGLAVDEIVATTPNGGTVPLAGPTTLEAFETRTVYGAAPGATSIRISYRSGDGATLDQVIDVRGGGG